MARDGRLGDRLINTDYNNFAPRLGIAFSPSAKWSIRTGFGMFYSQESKNSIFDMSRATAGAPIPLSICRAFRASRTEFHQYQSIAGVVRAGSDVGR